jgi:hypothetical protein
MFLQDRYASGINRIKYRQEMLRLIVFFQIISINEVTGSLEVRTIPNDLGCSCLSRPILIDWLNDHIILQMKGKY